MCCFFLCYSKKVAVSLDFIFRTSVIKFAIAELAKQVFGKRFVNVEDKTEENCQLANFICVASLSLQLDVCNCGTVYGHDIGANMFFFHLDKNAQGKVFL